MVMDALHSIHRLASAASAIAFDRLHPGRRAFPASVDEVDAAWLNAALAKRHPGARIRGFEVLDDHSGTTSRARIRLDVDPAPESATLPETLFLKTTPRGFAQRLFLDATGIGRSELEFYAHIRADLPVRAPRLHGLESVGNGRQFVLLLEDLEAAGARMASIGDRVSREEAEGVVMALAKLHAGFWQSDRFRGDLAWVPSYETRQRDLPWERFVTGQMIGITSRRFATEFPASFGEVAAFCSQRRNLLERLWSTGDRTFVHGDCHVGNLFFEEAGVGFLDWQVCARAPGMRDVSYFMCGSLPSDSRRAYEKDLITIYLDQLARHGVAPPTFEEAWNQHRLFALYTFIASAFTAAAGAELQPIEIGKAGLRRAHAAAEELDSIGCALGLARTVGEEP